MQLLSVIFFLSSLNVAKSARFGLSRWFSAKAESLQGRSLRRNKCFGSLLAMNGGADADGLKNKSEICIGIDLGTTYRLVSFAFRATTAGTSHCMCSLNSIAASPCGKTAKLKSVLTNKEIVSPPLKWHGLQMASGWLVMLPRTKPPQIQPTLSSM